MNRILQERYRNFTTEELVTRYQRTKNEDKLREVMRRNNGLLHKWVRDYSNIPLSEEDLLEEGYIALWRAVDNYNVERGVTFSTYLKDVVQQHYNRIYQQATRQKRYTGYTPDSWEVLSELHKEKAVEFELLSDLSVREFINSLEGKVQEIAVLLLEGNSKSDIARIFDIKPATITYYCRKLERLTIEYFSLGGSERLIKAI